MNLDRYLGVAVAVMITLASVLTIMAIAYVFVTLVGGKI